jgi:hypothetical protein
VSVPGTTQLRVDWGMDAVRDLRAFFGIDVEQELIATLRAEMAQEIDREIIQRMIN